MPMTADDQLVCVDLNERGELLDRDGNVVAMEDLPRALPALLRIPREATDIVLFVHGWRNSRAHAAASARRLLAGATDLYGRHPGSYPAITDFRPYCVAVRWPSSSSPFPGGYRRIRDRAHAMTTSGHAELVLGHILGYLNVARRTPGVDESRFGTADSQYLHCVGHSFGGRFLGEAIMAAASPASAPRSAWPWASPDYPYTVDTLLVFQMAAQPTIFADEFQALLDDAPINGPTALTFSRHDRATSLWHRLAEGTPGIGAIGATEPTEQITSVRLHRADEPYHHSDVPTRLLNVDAGWRFRRGRCFRLEGAHSDIWHPESMHLLLALAALAR